MPPESSINMTMKGAEINSLVVVVIVIIIIAIVIIIE